MGTLARYQPIQPKTKLKTRQENISTGPIFQMIFESG